MHKILLIDNYDSFTFNLVHYLEEFDCDVTVWRNDEFDILDVGPFPNIVLSPGPGIPQNAGRLLELIRTYANTKNIFGICLGMQAIGEVFGAGLINLRKVHHGVASDLKVIDTDEIIYKNLPTEMQVGRYHSWIVDRYNFPTELKITAVDQDGMIMSLRHRELSVCGVQFHPESILTSHGKSIIKNWINGIT